MSAYVDSDHIITRCIIMSFRIVSFTEHSLKPGWGCSSVGRALDRHGADAGSIPRCGKGFFSPSQLSVLTLQGVRTPPCAIACIYIRAHIKDPVVPVRVRWIIETLKHPACTVGWVARLCRSWLSLEKATRIYHGKKSHWGNTVVKKQTNKQKSVLSVLTAG